MGHLSREREELESLSEVKFCHVGAAVGVAVGAVGVSMLSGGGGGGGGAPDPNPGMIANAEASAEAARVQAQVSREYLDFYKTQYNELKPLMQEVYQSQIASQRANDERAADYAAYERNTFRPLEQRLVNQVNAFDTDARREQMARQASADVSQAFDVARGTQNRQFASIGIRPDSGRFASLNQNLLTQEALARAGAANKARTDAENLGFARSMDVTALGRNLAPNATAASQTAINAGNSAVDNMNKSTDMMGQGYRGAIAGYGSAAQSYGTSGNIYGQEFAGRMQGYSADQAAQGAMYQGIGSAVGTIGGFALKKYGADGGEVPRGLRYADGTHVGGGKVTGPGGPIDDKVPAMLSNGEYVLPADTVKKVGVKKLDKLVKETHTPAAEQRKKKALKGKK